MAIRAARFVGTGKFPKPEVAAEILRKYSSAGARLRALRVAAMYSRRDKFLSSDDRGQLRRVWLARKGTRQVGINC